MNSSDAQAPPPTAKAAAVSGRGRLSLRGNRLLTGSALLLASTTIVNLGNYLFNLLMGRWLGPAAFADVSLMITLFLVVALVTATFQTISARFSAIYQVGTQPALLSGLRRWGVRWAWGVGIFFALAMVAGAPLWAEFFHTATFWPFVIFGLGVPVYFAQGVDRGILQGQMRFSWLALSYQAEMWARLVLGVLFVWAGYAVNGAVAALSLSFVATWLVAREVRRKLAPPTAFAHTEQRAALIYAGPVIMALIGQIMINNSDVLLVKHYYPPAEAGLYAALALVGRIVFFATWSVVMVLLPSVAQRHQQGQPHRHLLWASLALVGAASVVVISMCYFFDELVLGLLFGAEYLAVAPLLWVYALATTLFALANVFITYGLSLGKRTGSYFALGAGIAQILGIIFFHASLTQVVLVQVYVMVGLVLALLINQLWSFRGERKSPTTTM